MLINDVANKDELATLILGELKDLGVKYRKEKKTKAAQEKICQKRIFHCHLHLLELTDVVLANGGVVQIPQFVSDACQRILELVETEGLFRKAGSSLRQKEIRISLEAGLPLGRSHHVIDVANVVKSFFRELPEPLLPPTIQEALIRSLLIGQHRVRAILMTCLLLPPLTINTLAFFMQFLNTVSMNAHLNKMSIENLAIIFAPGLMPIADINEFRINNHVKIVQILIENAEEIGILPNDIIDKLQFKGILTPTNSKSTEIMQNKKKKKRRSGSLTRMFNGFRKIVGAIGSSENLESTPENSLIVTPCITKSSKKRKLPEPASAFSAKKKKDLLSLLPANGGILPNTPVCTKEPKKRLSLGGRRNLKYSSNNSIVSSMERRWSIVGSGLSRIKRNNIDFKKENPAPPLSPVVSMPCISNIDVPKPDFEVDESLQQEIDMYNKNKVFNVNVSETDNENEEYVRVNKNEYEAIKERVHAIETRISQEFKKVRGSLNKKSRRSCVDDLDCSLTGPQRVLNKFEETCETTENLSSPTTDNLAKRLSRELKIRRSDEHRVIRSPSARKIGTIRRRSRENVRLSRNKTWHISGSSTVTNNNLKNDNINTAREVGGGSFYPKSNLKRGRPNTLQTGLPTPTDNKEILMTPICDTVENESTNNEDDEWTSGEIFFTYNKNVKTNSQVIEEIENLPPRKKVFKSNIEINSTPKKLNNKILLDNMKTPMLPPKSIPRRPAVKTPGSVTHSASKPLTANRLFGTPVDDSQSGRASIARLRTQMAGMVMEKAKLFDGLGNIDSLNKDEEIKIKPLIENRRRSNRFVINKFHEQTKDLSQQEQDQQHTPRHKNTTKSPGFIQKRQLYSGTKYPNKNLISSLIIDDEVISKKVNKVKKSVPYKDNKGSPLKTQMPQIRKTLHVNSPRRVRTSRCGSVCQSNSSISTRTKTPLKATTPLRLRNSPRLASRNRHI